MKFPVKDFFSKCDQIRWKLQIWSHLLKKSLMENFIFCAVIMLYFRFQKLVTDTFYTTSHFILRCQCFSGGYFIEKEIFFICSFQYYFKMKVDAISRKKRFCHFNIFLKVFKRICHQATYYLILEKFSKMQGNVWLRT